jgi:hypothetical protein
MGREPAEIFGAIEVARQSYRANFAMFAIDARRSAGLDRDRAQIGGGQ